MLRSISYLFTWHLNYFGIFFLPLIQDSSPPGKNRDASPPPSPSCHVTPLQRQNSGSHGIKGILKKSRSTSVESDQSEGSAPPTPARQGSITLSHPESDEEMEEEVDEDSNAESYRDEGSLSEDITDGAGFSANRQQTGGRSSSSSSSRSFEEMSSPSPDGSLEQSSSVSEDVEELEGSLDGSQGSSLKQRSLSRSHLFILLLKQQFIRYRIQSSTKAVKHDKKHQMSLFSKAGRVHQREGQRERDKAPREGPNITRWSFLSAPRCWKCLEEKGKLWL